MENRSSTTSVTIQDQIQSRPSKSILWLLGYLSPIGGDGDFGDKIRSRSLGEGLSKLSLAYSVASGLLLSSVVHMTLSPCQMFLGKLQYF